MLKRYNMGNLIDHHFLLDMLGIDLGKRPIISVVGAGGKTTSIKRMAAEFRNSHIPVVVTTTTHMMAEEFPWFLLEPSIEKTKSILEREGMVWLGLPDIHGKMKAPPREFLGQVLNLEYPVLIEADGAKKLPLKVPAEHEPVLLKETTHVVNVYGLDAIGKKFEEVCFRADRAVEFLNRKITDKVQTEDIVTLALSSRSGRKGVLSSMDYHVILNKADNSNKIEIALEICRLAEKKGFTEFIVTAEN